jgi:hypothetical protein
VTEGQYWGIVTGAYSIELDRVRELGHCLFAWGHNFGCP